MPSNSSLIHYLNTYKYLVKRVGDNDLTKIFKWINESNKKDQTKLSYLNSIIGVKQYNDKLIKSDLSNIIKTRDEINEKIKNDRSKNNITERQSEAMKSISRDDLIKYADKLEKHKGESKKDLENYLLVKLIINYPVRNDLSELFITHFKNDVKKIHNSIYIPKTVNSKAVITIKDHKTSNSSNGKPIIITLDSDITNDIKELMKDNRQYLFESINGKPVSSSGFTNRLNRIFKKEFGIPISSTIIRKIYLSDKYADTLKEMKQDAELLGHSMATQRDVYIDNK